MVFCLSMNVAGCYTCILHPTLLSPSALWIAWRVIGLIGQRRIMFDVLFRLFNFPEDGGGRWVGA